MFVYVLNVCFPASFTDPANEEMIVMRCGTVETLRLILASGFRPSAKHFASTVCRVFFLLPFSFI